MNENYFCDTSTIIKLYHNEIGTNRMESLFNDDQATIIISELITVEFYSALSKKVRTGEITDEAKNEAIKNFEKDSRNKFIITPLDSRIIKKARNIINKYGNTSSIRTLDALQLAACLVEKKDGLQFVCADVNLLNICKLEGLQTMNPETDVNSA